MGLISATCSQHCINIMIKKATHVQCLSRKFIMELKTYCLVIESHYNLEENTFPARLCEAAINKSPALPVMVEGIVHSYAQWTNLIIIIKGCVFVFITFYDHFIVYSYLYIKMTPIKQPQAVHFERQQLFSWGTKLHVCYCVKGLPVNKVWRKTAMTLMILSLST